MLIQTSFNKDYSVYLENKSNVLNHPHTFCNNEDGFYRGAESITTDDYINGRFNIVHTTKKHGFSICIDGISILTMASLH